MSVLFFIILLAFQPLSQPPSQVVVYFYEEGCPQCEQLTPVLEELSQEYSFTILKYDVATVEGYNLFKQYGFTRTPALLIKGKKLEGVIDRKDIIDALSGFSWYNFLLALALGVVSGFSPTFMNVHSDIIAEVGRTTRRESDVFVRSLIFYAGIFAVAFCLFVALINFHFGTVLLGFVISMNLLNSGLHFFNSYTKIDSFIKSKFMTLNAYPVLKLGALHGAVKFPDSAPFFIPLLYLAIIGGSLSKDFIIFGLFLFGIVLSYVVVLVLAIVELNLFRKFKDQLVNQLYFAMSGIAVMVISAQLLWEIMDELNMMVSLVLLGIVVCGSGILIGLKRRIIY